MTPTPEDKLKDCREAFEEWFFEYRAELRKHNIFLDDNDANSAYSGFEAAWNTRATLNRHEGEK